MQSPVFRKRTITRVSWRLVLVSETPEVVNRHLAKVYGQVSAPTMSVPHIDTRMLTSA
ncbi:MAG: malate:quinone oxidoreductase [Enterobacter hormaechei]